MENNLGFKYQITIRYLHNKVNMRNSTIYLHKTWKITQDLNIRLQFDI